MKLTFVQVTLDVQDYVTGLRQPPPLCPVKTTFIPGIRWIWPIGLPHVRKRATSPWGFRNLDAAHDFSMTRPLPFDDGYRFEPVEEDFVDLDDDPLLKLEERREGGDVWD